MRYSPLHQLLPIAFILLLSAQAVAQSSVPCELDPFCDDPDGPIEVPLDDELIFLVIGGTLLAYTKMRRIKKSRLVS